MSKQDNIICTYTLSDVTKRYLGIPFHAYWLQTITLNFVCLPVKFEISCTLFQKIFVTWSAIKMVIALMNGVNLKTNLDL